MLNLSNVLKPGRTILLSVLLASVASVAASAQSVVRIGMTSADIPRTLGQPDQGFEGNRFTGNTMYDGLTQWDLSSADKASVAQAVKANAFAKSLKRPLPSFPYRVAASSAEPARDRACRRALSRPCSCPRLPYRAMRRALRA